MVIYKGKINNYSMNNCNNDDKDNDNDGVDWGVSISFADFKKVIELTVKLVD